MNANLSYSFDNFSVDEVNWLDAQHLLAHVRKSVFGYEQRVPSNIDFDGKDQDCFHVLVTDSSGAAIGTGRMTSKGKIGRVAVLISHRGQGIGSQILEALIAIAKKNNIDMVKLHAQIQAIDFYQRHQFKVQGPVFMEAGIPHQSMLRYCSQQ
ncbi:MAG: GNAT family N-acetyltransferase [Kangiellaceae bacterium]|jgi:predicted GNAT family N-acyltransferase|nr:GNAT family N-acetyltransferase [Kangiellaceae bacterium]